MSSFLTPPVEQLCNLYPEFMILHMYVDSAADSELVELYAKSVEKHNKHILENSDQFNSGFDMFVTEVQSVANGHMRLIDFNVACAAEMYRTHGNLHCRSSKSAFYVYPRSSISKTELRLANNVGIIDSGYRGNLMGYFDAIKNEERFNPESPEITFGNRITQICAPGLQPIYVVLVNNRENLGTTVRGDGGFGSTGR